MELYNASCHISEPFGYNKVVREIYDKSGVDFIEEDHLEDGKWTTKPGYHLIVTFNNITRVFTMTLVYSEVRPAVP